MFISNVLRQSQNVRFSRSLSSVLEVSPCSSLLDCEVTVTGRCLKPEAVVSLETRLQDTELNFDFQSVSQFLTDDRGEFSTAVDSPLPGSSYAGVHRSGPLWSVQRRPGSKYRLWPEDIRKPLHYQFSLSYSDTDQIIATAEATKTFVSEGVRRVEVRDGDLRGTLFLPPSPGPAILTIYGGVYNGVIPEDRAALLASYGFVTLAVAFYGVDDLPPVYTSFELSYFERAVDFLLSHQHVINGTKVGMFGSSIGGSLVLAMMSCFGDKVGPCVVTGSQFIFSPGPCYYRGDIIVEPTEWNLEKDWDNPFEFRQSMEDVLRNEKQLVQFHNSSAPLLLLSGLDDGVAKDLAPIMVKRAQAAGKENVRLVEYSETGHLIDPPHCPFNKYLGHPLLPKSMKMHFGGQLQPHALAQIEAWRETLQFFKHHA